MPVYKAPLRDMKFLLNEVFDYPGHYATLTSGENATPDIVDAIPVSYTHLTLPTNREV